MSNIHVSLTAQQHLYKLLDLSYSNVIMYVLKLHEFNLKTYEM
jgi:hypothetical protein